MNMDPRKLEESSRRPSGFSTERIMFYVDEASVECQNSPEDFYNLEGGNSSTLWLPSSGNFRLDDRSALYPPSPDSIILRMDNRRASLYPSSLDERPRRGSSIYSHAGGSRRSNGGLDVDQRPSRRSSIYSTRSRTNSYCRSTPLGDDRRASICKKPRPRRVSSRRKDSVMPTRIEEKEAQKVIQEAEELQQTRRHRRIAMIVLGTFVFLLTASVLVVVITLTHSSFLSPATGSKELAEHRAQLRKENEQLLNSLNRDSSVPTNFTASP